MRKMAAGFSLLQVLIALSLLAVMATELATLHGATRQAARQTTISADAFVLAAELADWLRNAAPPRDWEDSFALLESATSATVASCFRQDCTPAQVMAFDLSQWHQRVLRLIPAARISICRDTTATAWHWHCTDKPPLTAPMMIRIGWPLPSSARDFPPSIALAVGALAR